MYDVRIIGTGVYRPKRKVSGDEIRAIIKEKTGRAVPEEARVSSRTRYFAAPEDGETATFMGMKAADAALESAGLRGHDLDLIVNASGTAPQAIPDGAALLQRELGLGMSGIPCMSIHATCLSFLAALRLVAPLIHLGEHRNVLIVSSDIASGGIDWTHTESAFLFGDGAAAVVLTGSEGGSRIERMLFRTYGDGSRLTEIRGGGTTRHPDAPHTVPKDNTFQMQGDETLEFTMGVIPDFLAEFGADPDALDFVVPHQASKAGLQVLEALGWEREKVANILGETGNCVAASLPMALVISIEEGKLHGGDRIAMLGTGAGLSVGGAILTY